MKKQDIRTNVVIDQVNRGGKFVGHLEDNPEHQVMLTVSGRMQCGKIKVVRGDVVDAVLTPYDLTRGRITWRYPDPQQRGVR